MKFDKALYRPVELEVIYGNPKRAKTELDWNYNLSFDALIKAHKDEIKYQEWWMSKASTDPVSN